jgi:hypothetical protein
MVLGKWAASLTGNVFASVAGNKKDIYLKVTIPDLFYGDRKKFKADAISPSAVYSRSRLLYVLPPLTHTLPDHLELGILLSQVIKPLHKALKVYRISLSYTYSLNRINW